MEQVLSWLQSAAYLLDARCEFTPVPELTIEAGTFAVRCAVLDLMKK